MCELWKFNICTAHGLSETEQSSPHTILPYYSYMYTHTSHFSLSQSVKLQQQKLIIGFLGILKSFAVATKHILTNSIKQMTHWADIFNKTPHMNKITELFVCQLPTNDKSDRSKIIHRIGCKNMIYSRKWLHIRIKAIILNRKNVVVG